MNNKNNKLIILIVLLLFISLGYAILTQTLTITGTTKINANTGSIHFNNVQINSNSVSLSTGDSAAAINQSDNTLVEYTVTLNQPGDYYEFTVDAVNDGSIDGMINTVVSKLNGTTISSINPLPAYLDYSVTYSDGVAIAQNHLLAANTTETYKVRVEFKRNIENSELPSTAQTLSFNFGVQYVQADSNVIAVPHPVVEPLFVTYYSTPSPMGIIGNPVPTTIPNYIFTTSGEAYTSLFQSYNRSVPFLSYEVTDGIITSIAAELVVTSDMATANPGMTAGTYSLRGAGLTRLYDATNDRYYFEDIPYEDNVAVLLSAFGSSNCNVGTSSTYCSVTYQDGAYTRNYTGSANSNGYVYWSQGSLYCEVTATGGSWCYQD